MADFALELSFDDAGTAAVAAQWEALLAAGLPSQAEHRSMTNAPHLTLVAAVSIDVAVVELARSLVVPLLPSRLVVRGLLLLGDGPRVTVAHLVEPSVEVAQAAAQLRAAVGDGSAGGVGDGSAGGVGDGAAGGVRHPVWTPHVTLARRVPRRRVPEVLGVLEAHPVREVIADRLRWWDPVQGVVETLHA